MDAQFSDTPVDGTLVTVQLSEDGPRDRRWSWRRATDVRVRGCFGFLLYGQALDRLC